MGSGRLIPLALFLTATPAWGGITPAGEAIVGEVLQQEITVAPARIARRLEPPPAWTPAAVVRPEPLAPPFPGVERPPAAASAHTDSATE
ncbi:MAG: hypothetical protein COW73_09230 [Nitrospirae bacterium CG18_big_fil_WC_8_21_14_2_50_70_55]|nr:hypothetical protein [Deltaproteobacteria bacterium]OIP63956.1 MAG: hypothetical protein AUK30_07430 [Nitrospirae bacterium CG2_30_70_394]PIQ04085.1 MAG: hypothetical protein COW73_09230 [Nitrospirae bacterium CG18_big_fil_WC_8_21_14_2_50_70_55]PIU77708.1 MAG: hypothetical protein COS73_09135 [Nitrospirae bacterium CG06_land_8_20_14_3_00_70_43]PIW82554.1 MAG: hypothetical protein COZ96_08045 [Nitrospirae bacterium CG_4_8_14_3_um_filter_70_85]PIX83796.1 MAG: hypothetical protein COZ33_03600 